LTNNGWTANGDPDRIAIFLGLTTSFTCRAVDGLVQFFGTGAGGTIDAEYALGAQWTDIAATPKITPMAGTHTVDLIFAMADFS
jgi:hypothetical protein